MTNVVALEWMEAINDQDLSRLRQTLADDFIWELGTASTQGAEASVEAWRLWFVGFPDFRFELQRAICEGAFVALQVRMRGTHKGEFRFRGTASMTNPIAATNRSFELPGCAVHEINNSRIVRLSAYWDTATLLRQIEEVAA